MEVSTSGLIGAAIGFGVGVVDWYVVTRFVVSRLRAGDTSVTVDEKAAFDRKIVLFRRAFAGVAIVFFSGLGYAIGTGFGG